MSPVCVRVVEKEICVRHFHYSRVSRMIRATSTPELEVSAKRLHARNRSTLSSAANSRRVPVTSDLEQIDGPKRYGEGRIGSAAKRRAFTPEMIRSRSISAVSRRSFKSEPEPKTTKTSLLRQQIAVEQKRAMEEEQNRKSLGRNKLISSSLGGAKTAPTKDDQRTTADGSHKMDEPQSSQRYNSESQKYLWNKTPFDVTALKLDFRGLHDEDLHEGFASMNQERNQSESMEAAGSVAEDTPIVSKVDGRTVDYGLTDDQDEKDASQAVAQASKHMETQEHGYLDSSKSYGHNDFGPDWEETSVSPNVNPSNTNMGHPVQGTKSTRKLATYTKPTNTNGDHIEPVAGPMAKLPVGSNVGTPSSSVRTSSSKKLASYRRGKPASSEEGMGNPRMDVAVDENKAMETAGISGGERRAQGRPQKAVESNTQLEHWQPEDTMKKSVRNDAEEKQVEKLHAVDGDDSTVHHSQALGRTDLENQSSHSQKMNSEDTPIQDDIPENRHSGSIFSKNAPKMHDKAVNVPSVRSDRRSDRSRVVGKFETGSKSGQRPVGEHALEKQHLDGAIAMPTLDEAKRMEPREISEIEAKINIGKETRNKDEDRSESGFTRRSENKSWSLDSDSGHKRGHSPSQMKRHLEKKLAHEMKSLASSREKHEDQHGHHSPEDFRKSEFNSRIGNTATPHQAGQFFSDVEKSFQNQRPLPSEVTRSNFGNGHHNDHLHHNMSQSNHTKNSHSGNSGIPDHSDHSHAIRSDRSKSGSQKSSHDEKKKRLHNESEPIADHATTSGNVGAITEEGHTGRHDQAHSNKFDNDYKYGSTKSTTRNSDKQENQKHHKIEAADDTEMATKLMKSAYHLLEHQLNKHISTRSKKSESNENRHHIRDATDFMEESSRRIAGDAEPIEERRGSATGGTSPIMGTNRVDLPVSPGTTRHSGHNVNSVEHDFSPGSMQINPIKQPGSSRANVHAHSNELENSRKGSARSVHNVGHDSPNLESRPGNDSAIMSRPTGAAIGISGSKTNVMNDETAKHQPGTGRRSLGHASMGRPVHSSGQNVAESQGDEGELLAPEKLDTIRRYLEDQASSEQEHTSDIHGASELDEPPYESKTAHPYYYLATVIEKVTEEKRQLVELCYQLLQQTQSTAKKLVEIESRQEQNLASFLPNQRHPGKTLLKPVSAKQETETNEDHGRSDSKCRRCQQLERYYREKIDQLRAEYEEKLASLKTRQEKETGNFPGQWAQLVSREAIQSKTSGKDSVAQLEERSDHSVQESNRADNSNVSAYQLGGDQALEKAN